MRDWCYGLALVATAACSMPDVGFHFSDDGGTGLGTGGASSHCFGSVFLTCLVTLPTRGLIVGAPGSSEIADNFDAIGPDIDTDASPRPLTVR